MFQLSTRHSLYPVLITYFLDVFALAIVYPIFSPLLLRPEFHLLPHIMPYFERTIVFAFLIASFPLAQIFGAPIIGSMSDRFGRKIAFVATIAGTGVGFVLTALAIERHMIFLLFFSRIWTGFFAGNQTICLAAITDISTDEHTRAKNFGLLGGVNGLGFILAILAGGNLFPAATTSSIDPSLPFWLISWVCGINLILMLILFKESLHLTANRRSPLQLLDHTIFALKIKPLRIAYAAYFFFVICWIPSIQYLPGYLIHVFSMGEETIFWAFIGSGIIWSFANLAVNPYLAARFHPYKTQAVSLLFLGLLVFILPFEGLTLFLILFLLSVFFASLSWTNCLTTVSLCVPKSIQGGVLGINQSITAVGSIVGPLIGGFFGAINSHLTYIFTGLCSLFAAFLLYQWKDLIAKKQ